MKKQIFKRFCIAAIGVIGGTSGISHSINISEQAPGIYFIQVLEKGKSNLVKYIKQ